MQPGVISKALSVSAALRVSTSLAKHAERMQKANQARQAAKIPCRASTLRKPTPPRQSVPAPASTFRPGALSRPVATKVKTFLAAPAPRPLKSCLRSATLGVRTTQRVHFQHTDKTVASVRFFEPEVPPCVTARGFSGGMNQPHEAGQVIVDVGKGTQTRYDGTYYPPSWVGTVSEDRCKYCLALQENAFARGYCHLPDDFDRPGDSHWLSRVGREDSRRFLRCFSCLGEEGGSWGDDDDF